jgi:large subunit ribosomal protein L25
VADLTLAVRPRTELGRHVRALRRAGYVPAVLYGAALPPRAIAAEAGALARIWARAGRSHLVDLSIDGKSSKVLIREYQIDPRTARPLHADFLAVNLREKLAVDIPVTASGEAPAVTQLKIGVLQQVVNSLRIEALPGNLPSHLSVDVSHLTEVDQAVRIRDVVLPSGVALVGHLDPDEVVMKIAPLRVTVEEVPAAVAPEAGAEGEAAASTEEGATPPEA